MASPTKAISGNLGRPAPVGAQSGFTYLMLLLWVVLAGVMLAALGTSWHLMSRREREAELLWRGEQYKQALASYSRVGAKLQAAAAEAASAATATAASPTTPSSFSGDVVQGQAQPAQAAQAIPPQPTSGPLDLKDLLEDRRSGKVQRHLRRLYSDPITGSPRWGLIRSVDGRIAGVYSLSDAEPLRVGLGVQHYRELVFGNAGAAASSPASSPASTASGAAAEPNPNPKRTGGLPWLDYGPKGSRN